MLVLGMRQGETVEITLANGELIRVMAVQISGAKLRLGIDAPGDCAILRGELADRMRAGESLARSGHDEPVDRDGPA